MRQEKYINHSRMYLFPTYIELGPFPNKDQVWDHEIKQGILHLRILNLFALKKLKIVHAFIEATDDSNINNLVFIFAS